MTFGAHEILQGDVLEVLRELPDNCFDGLLSDPPYGFSFMGKKWDYDVPSVEVWREAFRVLKPGAPLLSFGGARTFHRVAVGVEDAGFELRDCLTWLYAKGFPKSLNVGLAIDKAAGAEREVIGIDEDRLRRKPNGMQTPGATAYGYSKTQQETDARITAPATELAQQWDGYGTALKPAWEPIILARKPLEGTVASNVAKWGVGGLAIDACRIEASSRPLIQSGTKTAPAVDGWGGLGQGSRFSGTTDEGRWPANLCFDEEAAAQLDAAVGNRPSRKSVTRNGGGNQGGPVFANRESKARPDSGRNENGGPSRFFFCSKVSTKEREHGCGLLPHRSAGEATGGRQDGSAGLANPRAGAGRTGGAHNHHPTLKPIALTRWLASLIKPPTEDCTLLVPYSGAGSEIIGALQAGWPAVVGIEGEADYIEIANARIAAWGQKEAA